MKLRSPFWKPHGWEGLAVIETHRNGKELFKPVLRVGGPIAGAISTFLAKLADYEILEATEEEIEELQAAGYEMRGCDCSPVAVVEQVPVVEIAPPENTPVTELVPSAERSVFRKADYSVVAHALRTAGCRLKNCDADHRHVVERCVFRKVDFPTATYALQRSSANLKCA